MKKKFIYVSILLVFSLILFSCTTGGGLTKKIDTNLENQSGYLFDNPEWMQGYWGKNGDLYMVITDTHILLVSSSDVQSYGDSVAEITNITTDDTLGYNNLKIEYKAKNGYNFTLEYTQESPDTLNYLMYVNGNPITSSPCNYIRMSRDEL